MWTPQGEVVVSCEPRSISSLLNDDSQARSDRPFRELASRKVTPLYETRVHDVKGIPPPRRMSRGAAPFRLQPAAAGTGGIAPDQVGRGKGIRASPGEGEKPQVEQEREEPA